MGKDGDEHRRSGGEERLVHLVTLSVGAPPCPYGVAYRRVRFRVIQQPYTLRIGVGENGDEHCRGGREERLVRLAAHGRRYTLNPNPVSLISDSTSPNPNPVTRVN